MSNKCTCGRSPNGNCVGWHNLSEEDYKKDKKTITKRRKINLKVFNVLLGISF